MSNPMDYSPPGYSVHGISQARILEWVSISSPGDLSDPGIKPASPALVGGFFTTEPPGGGGGGFIHLVVSDSCNPMDYSPPVSSVREIFQARIPEWVAISFFMGSSQPRNRTWVSCTGGRFFTD